MEYKALMESVREFAEGIGLKTDRLCAEVSDSEKWVISVSHKTSIDNSNILYSAKDEMSPNFNRLLRFPVVSGSKDEIEEYRKRAEKQDADYFVKEIIAWNGTVRPTPEFLALNSVEQVEYALHEAFHTTPKMVFDEEKPLLPFEYEEPSALIAGYLGAIAYFINADLTDQAVQHWQKHLGLARKVNAFVEDLDQLYGFRVDKDHQPISREQKLEERKDVLARAEKEFNGELGTPVNNALFLYWSHYYAYMPVLFDNLREPVNIDSVIKQLTEFKEWIMP